MINQKIRKVGIVNMKILTNNEYRELLTASYSVGYFEGRKRGMTYLDIKLRSQVKQLKIENDMLHRFCDGYQNHIDILNLKISEEKDRV